MEFLTLGTGLALVIIGLWGLLSQKNIIKIIIGFSIMDTGIHVVMVSIGYIKNRTAPILDSSLLKNSAASLIVDPLPQALVLTAIVIGLGITALMLGYALRLYENKKSLEITKFEDLKW